jgi:putative tryptophan/tyrosine transport system substrate-binding protein
MTVQILAGTKISEIPFYLHTKFELVLNQKAAKSLALEFPSYLLALADEVIE